MYVAYNCTFIKYRGFHVQFKSTVITPRKIMFKLSYKYTETDRLTKL